LPSGVLQQPLFPGNLLGVFCAVFNSRKHIKISDPASLFGPADGFASHAQAWLSMGFIS
jgi:hypothetical protein